jgi:hypothetical protein
MHSEHPFTISEQDGQPSLVLDLTNGRLSFDLAPGTSPERAEEIADYLNLVIHEVAFTKTGNIQPDLERLNEEQPVSAAVEHP